MEKSKKTVIAVIAAVIIVIIAVIIAVFAVNNKTSAEKATAPVSATADVNEGETAVTSAETDTTNTTTTTTTTKANSSNNNSSNSGKSNGSSSSGSSSGSSGSSSSSSGGSSSSSGSSSKPSTTKKPTTTKPSTTKPSTTKPKSFAMSASEIRSYALNEIAKIDGTIYVSEFTKYNSGWNTPLVVYPGDSATKIKEGIKGKIWWYNGTTKNGYNVYVENTTDYDGDKCMKVYFLYGQAWDPDTEL